MNPSNNEQPPQLPPEALQLAEGAIENARSGEKYAQALAEKAAQRKTFRPLTNTRQLRRNRKAILTAMRGLHQQDKERNARSVFKASLLRSTVGARFQQRRAGVGILSVTTERETVKAANAAYDANTTSGNYHLDGNGSIRLTRDPVADIRRARALKHRSTDVYATY